MVDIQPQSTQPISDDQELAKVLAGVTDQPGSNDLSFTDLPTPSPSPDATADSPPIGYNPPVEDSKPAETPRSEPVATAPEPLSTPSVPAMPSFNATEPSNDLEGIKKDALNDLRPLVDKLDLEPEEKFDTYLLLLRSTDDKALIAPAHAAAKAIADESRRAKALLDIIKEIDFLSNPQ